MRIPDVALNIQQNVKQAIENMTGLKVVETNVHVQGVFSQMDHPEEEQQRVK